MTGCVFVGFLRGTVGVVFYCLMDSIESICSAH